MGHKKNDITIKHRRNEEGYRVLLQINILLTIWYTITKPFTYFKTIFCDNDNSEQLNENYICKGKALKTISLMCTG